jgi:putative hydrolase of HD superfamily
MSKNSVYLWGTALFALGVGWYSLKGRVSNDPKRSSAALKFFRTVGDLKRVKRTGWVNSQVREPESVADHMYRMTIMSFMIKDPSVDRDYLMRMCLVHDLAEAIVGDIVPHDTRVSKEEKRVMEENALRSICDDLNDPEVGNEIISLWLEYEDGTSPTALAAKSLDKFEMIVQADEYERHQERGSSLNDFFESTKHSITHPEVSAWSLKLREERNSRLEQEQQRTRL